MASSTQCSCGTPDACEPRDEGVRLPRQRVRAADHDVARRQAVGHVDRGHARIVEQALAVVAEIGPRGDVVAPRDQFVGRAAHAVEQGEVEGAVDECRGTGGVGFPGERGRDRRREVAAGAVPTDADPARDRRRGARTRAPSSGMPRRSPRREPGTDARGRAGSPARRRGSPVRRSGAGASGSRSGLPHTQPPPWRKQRTGNGPSPDGATTIPVSPSSIGTRSCTVAPTSGGSAFASSDIAAMTRRRSATVSGSASVPRASPASGAVSAAASWVGRNVFRHLFSLLPRCFCARTAPSHSAPAAVRSIEAPRSRSAASLSLRAGAASGPAPPSFHGTNAASRSAPAAVCSIVEGYNAGQP